MPEDAFPDFNPIGSTNVDSDKSGNREAGEPSREEVDRMAGPILLEFGTEW
jgi:hypothetical protein